MCMRHLRPSSHHCSVQKGHIGCHHTDAALSLHAAHLLGLSHDVCPNCETLTLTPTLARLQVTEGTLRLHLPELRQLVLSGVHRDQMSSRSQEESLLLDRDSFAEPSKLEDLTLELVALTPDCFTGMTALAALHLQRCDLARIPAALTALAASLTWLALPFNDGLQLADDDVKILLALRKLRELDLRKQSVTAALGWRHSEAAAAVEAHMHYQPALWSARSLQHLVDLPKAFLVQHGHVLALHVHEAEEGQEDTGAGV